MNIICTDIPQISSPADQKKIRDAVQEAINAKIRIQAERDLLKDIAAHIKETFNLKPRDFNKLVKINMESSIDKVLADTEALEVLQNQIFGNASETSE